MQLTEVSMPILSVKKVVEQGHRPEFHHGGGDIVHEKSGHRIPCRQCGGIYKIDFWVRDPRKKAQGAQSLTAAGFARPAPVPKDRHWQAAV